MAVLSAIFGILGKFRIDIGTRKIFGRKQNRRKNPKTFGRNFLSEKCFVEKAKGEGLVGLQGHRSVGGLRVSIYNAFPEAGIDALVSFMAEFERTHG